jgi:serine/threonine protein kinase
MPFCINCKKEIKKEWQSCPFCGTPNVLSGEKAETDNKQKDSLDKRESDSGTIDPGTGIYGLDYDNLPSGTLIDGKYRIEEKLGKGGFGTVYKAWYDNMDEWRALKIISREHYDDKEIIRDLRTEAKKLNIVNHSNVVRFYDVHLDGEIKYFDMEYIDGGDLVDLKLSYPDKRVPEERVRELALQIAEGMIAIHQKNIIHKDIKPQNVLLSKEGMVKITDFGIAEQFSSSRSRLKLASRAGTPAYMSPEHIIGEDVGIETDVWSFGVLIYELLTGKQLYRGESQTDILTQIERRPYKAVSDLSQRWNSLLADCLKYNFRERIGSFSDVTNYLKNKARPSKRQSSDLIENIPAKIRLPDLIDMIPVEGGSFMMGSDDKDAYDDEKPVHKVTLDSYFIGKHPVTQKQWLEIMGENPSYFREKKVIERGFLGIATKTELLDLPDNPVEKISWYDTIVFCNKLSFREGFTPVYSIDGDTNPNDWSRGTIIADWNANGYRLPTEAEWEYAARGGNKSKGFTYSGSNSIDDVAWYYRNSGDKTHPVGSKRANELGFYDMSGNVWEWCWDWYGEYSSSAKTNPRGPANGSYAVLRGGSWNLNDFNCRVATRNGDNRSYTYYLNGFRVARTRL